ncbi:MAG: glutamate--tRNA ligase [Chthonomonadales bacterium]|nr:glutamate--tRNA ligase [Chthonomonadales bacterium]
MRVRYAPSPTGAPHVGNVRTAIFNWLMARRTGGVFVCRLEDTDRDPARYRPEHVAEIEESLRFLGIVPDEWWVGGGPVGPYIQSERLERYRAAANRLVEQGRAYRCYCTEERLKEMRDAQVAAGAPTGYDRRCRDLAPAERGRLEAGCTPSVVRLAIPIEGRTQYRDLVYGDISVENRQIDDQVLLKSNGWPTYHLAVVVDDHEMGITHVIRGEDWQPSTPKQVLLYEALGWEPPAWVHVPLIVGSDRKKLSKRHGATRFMEFAREGYLPEALLNFLVLLGWSAGDENRELLTVAELMERFGIEGFSRNPAVFDYEKLRWMNGEYIRRAAPERLATLCLPYLEAAGLLASPPTSTERALLREVIPLVAGRLRVLGEVTDAASFFFRAPAEPEEKGRRKWFTGARAADILDRALAALQDRGDPLTPDGAEAMVNAVAADMDVERAPVIHTLRMAATGRTVGPGLFETLAVLGPDRLRERLAHAKTWVTA